MVICGRGAGPVVADGASAVASRMMAYPQVIHILFTPGWCITGRQAPGEPGYRSAENIPLAALLAAGSGQAAAE